MLVELPAVAPLLYSPSEGSRGCVREEGVAPCLVSGSGDEFENPATVVVTGRPSRGSREGIPPRGPPRFSPYLDGERVPRGWGLFAVDHETAGARLDR